MAKNKPKGSISGDVRDGRVYLMVNSPADANETLQIGAGTKNFSFFQILGNITLDGSGQGTADFDLPDPKNPVVGILLKTGIACFELPAASHKEARDFDFERVNDLLVHAWIMETVKIVSEMPITVYNMRNTLIGDANVREIVITPPVDGQQYGLRITVPSTLNSFMVTSVPSGTEIPVVF